MFIFLTLLTEMRAGQRGEPGTVTQADCRASWLLVSEPKHANGYFYSTSQLDFILLVVFIYLVNPNPNPKRSTKNFFSSIIYYNKKEKNIILRNININTY